MRPPRARDLAPALALCVLLPLSACGGDDPQDDTPDPGSAAAPGQTEPQVTVTRPQPDGEQTTPSVLTTPSPDAAQTTALLAALRTAFPGLQTARAVDDAVATCAALQASDGTPEATAGLTRATSIRFSGATTMTTSQAQAVLDVVRGEPWCR